MIELGRPTAHGRGICASTARRRSKGLEVCLSIVLVGDKRKAPTFRNATRTLRQDEQLRSSGQSDMSASLARPAIASSFVVDNCHASSMHCRATAEREREMTIWKRIGTSTYNNCTEFAFFRDDADLEFGFGGDLEKLYNCATKNGYYATVSAKFAKVILYGNMAKIIPDTYTHAIKRVDDHWEEVLGNDHNKWDDEEPPLFHGTDKIVMYLGKK